MHELEAWRRVFLESGQQGLKRRGLDPEEWELRRLQAKIGDMTTRLELAEHLLERPGHRDPRGYCVMNVVEEIVWLPPLSIASTSNVYCVPGWRNSGGTVTLVVVPGTLMSKTWKSSFSMMTS